MLGVLRFILALAVAFTHTVHLASDRSKLNMRFLVDPYHIGNMAVVVFFLISGYAMTHSILNNFHGSSEHILKFYEDRFLRIFPTYWFYFLASAVFVLLTSYGNPHFDIQKLLFNSTVVLLNFSSYFGPTMDIAQGYAFPVSAPLIPPAWSLGTELQFYLVIPFLIILVKKRKVRLFMSLFVLSLIWYICTLFTLMPVLAKYEFEYRSLPPVLFIFLSGSAYYLSKHDEVKTTKDFFRKVLVCTFIVVLICTILAHFFNTNGTSFSIGLAYLIGIGLVAIATNSKIRFPRQVDGFLGNLSYPVFLCHWLTLLFLSWYNQYFISPTVIKLVCWFIILMALSCVGYYLVDSPVQNFRRKFRESQVSTEALLQNNTMNYQNHSETFFSIGERKYLFGIAFVMLALYLLTAQPTPLINQNPPVSSEDTVKLKIETQLPSVPTLAEEGYKGYNIVKYNDVFYGANQAEGPMDIREINTKAKLPWVMGNSIAEVKSKVDTLPPQFLRKPLMARITNRLKKMFAE